MGLILDDHRLRWVNISFDSKHVYLYIITFLFDFLLLFLLHLSFVLLSKLHPLSNVSVITVQRQFVYGRLLLYTSVQDSYTSNFYFSKESHNRRNICRRNVCRRSVVDENVRRRVVVIPVITEVANTRLVSYNFAARGLSLKEMVYTHRFPF